MTARRVGWTGKQSLGRPRGGYGHFAGVFRSYRQQTRTHVEPTIQARRASECVPCATDTLACASCLYGYVKAKNLLGFSRYHRCFGR